MKRLYNASVMVDGLKLYHSFDTENEASMWVRLMTAQYTGRLASPCIRMELISEIFHEPAVSV